MLGVDHTFSLERLDSISGLTYSVTITVKVYSCYPNDSINFATTGTAAMTTSVAMLLGESVIEAVPALTKSPSSATCEFVYTLTLDGDWNPSQAYHDASGV